jgi:hypothetical protein
MKYYLGAYALSPTKKGWDAEVESAFYEDLKTLPNLKGLEHPFYGTLHEHDDDWFLANVEPQWDYVLTCIPGTMNALALDPHFGIASDDLDGRASALALIATTLRPRGCVPSNDGCCPSILTAFTTLHRFDGYLASNRFC